MRKYILRYLLFWLPAILLSYLLGGDQWAVQAVLWFFSLGMLLGWTVNTGMAAAHHPHRVPLLLLFYAGLHVLAISVVYATNFRSRVHIVLRAVGGFFSYRPMGPLLQVLRAYPIPAELVIIGIITVCCLVGFALGLLLRRRNPGGGRTQ